MQDFVGQQTDPEQYSKILLVTNEGNEEVKHGVNGGDFVTKWAS